MNIYSPGPPTSGTTLRVQIIQSDGYAAEGGDQRVLHSGEVSLAPTIRDDAGLHRVPHLRGSCARVELIACPGARLLGLVRPVAARPARFDCPLAAYQFNCTPPRSWRLLA